MQRLCSVHKEQQGAPVLLESLLRFCQFAIWFRTNSLGTLLTTKCSKPVAVKVAFHNCVDSVDWLQS